MNWLMRGKPAAPERKGRTHVGKSRDMHEAVGAELSSDPLIGTVNITVENMSRDVAPNGTVLSYHSRWRQPPRRVVGVTDAHTHLEVHLPPVDTATTPR